METLKILIPTDFSIQAEYAYLMVKKLAEKVNIDVHFLHVLNVPDTVTMDDKGNIQTCGEIDVNYVEMQKQIAVRQLSNLKSNYGNEINTHLVFGKTTDAIVSFSMKNNFNLIVMGTKGLWGIREIFSGTETQFVVRKSEVPVLSLMCDRSELSIRNILLVHDFMDETKEDLSLLRKIANSFGAKVHQLQMITKSDEAKIEQLKILMNQHAAEHGINNFENHFLLETDIENGVVHFNQMHEMDIVCIGTHGRSNFFHKGPSEKLINHLFKPIISFHLKNK